MAEPTLEELLAYQEERARSQQQAKSAEQAPSGLIQMLSSFLGAKGNPVGQPLAPYEESQGALRPRTLMDVIFGRK